MTDFAWPSLEPERRILAEIGVEVVVAESGDEDELVELAGEVDAILTNWKPVTERVLRSAPRCLTVARYGVGLDNIDVTAATELGIVVSNVPDFCVDEVSDHALALVLALSRHIVDFAHQTSTGGWDHKAFGEMRRLRGQTLGLIGFGRISRRVAAKAQAFGFDVLAYSPSLTPGEHDGVRAASFEEVLGSSAVSLHAPLTPTTRHLIGADQLAMMRPGAFLVNTARGALVDEAAMIAALKSGHIRHAGLDVFATEPLPPGHELTTLPNVTLSAHSAFRTPEASEALLRRALDIACKVAGKA